MFGIGSTELLVILVVALVVLGPKSLPGIAKTVGKVMGEFRRVSTEFQRTMNAEVANDEHEKRKKEAEEELFGKDENKSDAKADASTAKPASAPTAKVESESEQNVVDTQATPQQPAPNQTVPDQPAHDSPLAAAVAKAEAEATEATHEAKAEPVATSATSEVISAKEKELA